MGGGGASSEMEQMQGDKVVRIAKKIKHMTKCVQMITLLSEVCVTSLV